MEGAEGHGVGGWGGKGGWEGGRRRGWGGEKGSSGGGGYLVQWHGTDPDGIWVYTLLVFLSPCPLHTRTHTLLRTRALSVRSPTLAHVCVHSPVTTRTRTLAVSLSLRARALPYSCVRVCVHVHGHAFLSLSRSLSLSLFLVLALSRSLFRSLSSLLALFLTFRANRLRPRGGTCWCLA